MTFSLGSTPRSLVKYNDQSISAITEIAAGAKDSLVLIKELTASSSSTISFVNGTSDVVFDSTYPIYLFKFINIHGSDHNASGTGGLDFNVSIDAGSNYNIAKTSTAFTAYHNETDTGAGMGYNTLNDAAQQTTAIPLSGQIFTDNDSSLSGEVYFFNPSSTTFVKHFLSRNNRMDESSGPEYSNQYFVGGYANTTSAIDAVQFTPWQGTLDSGTFKLYGIKDS